MSEGCEVDYDNAPACSYFQHLHTSASAQTGVRERETERGREPSLVWLSLGLGRVLDGVTGLHLDAAPEVASAASAKLDWVTLSVCFGLFAPRLVTYLNAHNY